MGILRKATPACPGAKGFHAQGFESGEGLLYLLQRTEAVGSSAATILF
jgi:hypothetical protein